jgi:hypothetical protein
MTNGNENQRPEEVNAHKADDEVIIQAGQKISLPELLGYIEAGKTVIFTGSFRKAALAGGERRTPRGRITGHGAFRVLLSVSLNAREGAGTVTETDTVA